MQSLTFFIRLAVVDSQICEKSRVISSEFEVMQVRVRQGHRSWCQSKAHGLCDFPLVINSNFGRISYRPYDRPRPWPLLPERRSGSAAFRHYYTQMSIRYKPCAGVPHHKACHL